LKKIEKLEKMPDID
jgi:hypothetical protein